MGPASPILMEAPSPSLFPTPPAFPASLKLTSFPVLSCLATVGSFPLSPWTRQWRSQKRLSHRRWRLRKPQNLSAQPWNPALLVLFRLLTGNLSCPAPSLPQPWMTSVAWGSATPLDGTDTPGSQPEAGQTPGSLASELKCSPVLLDSEELAPVTPMEVYGPECKQAGQGSPCEEQEEPRAPVAPTPTLIKSDIVNEISNLSQGDASASFPGSEPPARCLQILRGGSCPWSWGYLQALVQPEMRLPAALYRLAAETDDSLLCDAGTAIGGGKAGGQGGGAAPQLVPASNR